jgi:TfoX/Sxy family transcriptional regulator of competence genes
MEARMAYNEKLAERIDAALNRINPPKLIDKKMFGGIGYLVEGNMACGVIEDHLIVRVGRELYATDLAKPGVKEFDLRGGPMTGWVMVSESVLPGEAELLEWVNRGVEFALTLPPK